MYREEEREEEEAEITEYEGKRQYKWGVIATGLIMKVIQKEWHKVIPWPQHRYLFNQNTRFKSIHDRGGLTCWCSFLPLWLSRGNGFVVAGSWGGQASSWLPPLWGRTLLQCGRQEDTPLGYLVYTWCFPNHVFHNTQTGVSSMHIHMCAHTHIWHKSPVKYYPDSEWSSLMFLMFVLV